MFTQCHQRGAAYAALFFIAVHSVCIGTITGPPAIYEFAEEDDGTCHLFYGAEGLYWTVFQSDLDFAVDVKKSEEEVLQGKTHFLDYNWDGGFRVWFGWNWDPGWELKATYTYFADEGKSRAESKDPEFRLSASLIHPATKEKYAEKANGKVKLDYQTVDLFFGKIICFCTNAFIFNPFFGTRGLSIDQHLRAWYRGGNFTHHDTHHLGQVHWNSDLKAAGLIAGMEMECHWDTGLGIYGGFLGSILASHRHTMHKQRLLKESEHSHTTQIKLKEKEWLSLPGFEVSGGIGWNGSCDDCLFYNIKLGYEFNQWFNTPKIRKYQKKNEGVSGSNSRKGFGLHGATLSAEIFF